MKKISLILFFFFCFEIKATNILDYETQLFTQSIINIICKANDYDKKINFAIVLDDNPNAYIDHNNKLFISTGLLKYAPSYEAVVGVLAHEIGHLDNYHISKRIKSIKNLQNLNQFASLSVIAGSLIANNNDYLIQSLVTNQMGIHNYYQSFSRDQEREADYYAIYTLDKLKLSNVPLIRFLNLLEKKSKQKGITDEYHKFLSHPIYAERYKIIDQITKKEEILFDTKINNKFNFIKAKLFGFTSLEFNQIEEYLDGDYLNYAQSIIFSRKGELKKSLKLINRLLEKKQNYEYLLETKADILYSHGYSEESLKFYKKIIKSYPNNHYVNKRIFDIKFTAESFQNSVYSENIFNNFSFLINIFYNDKELISKFKQIAKKNKKSDWISFFSIYQIIYNDIDINYNTEEITNKLLILLKNANDPLLKMIIQKEIKKINNA